VPYGTPDDGTSEVGNLLTILGFYVLPTDIQVGMDAFESLIFQIKLQCTFPKLSFFWTISLFCSCAWLAFAVTRTNPH